MAVTKKVAKKAAARRRLAGPVASDAMADALEAAKLLDVDVDHVAGIGVFVASRRWSWA